MQISNAVRVEEISYFWNHIYNDNDLTVFGRMKNTSWQSSLWSDDKITAREGSIAL